MCCRRIQQHSAKHVEANRIKIYKKLKKLNPINIRQRCIFILVHSTPTLTMYTATHESIRIAYICWNERKTQN